MSMTAIKKWCFVRIPKRHLSRAEWTLFLRALGVVVLIRGGLWVLPFRTLRHILARCGHAPFRHHFAPPPLHIAWAVDVASRFVPMATCLTQALSTDLLLKRAGYQGVLHIGVAIEETGKLIAHAWLEFEGQVLIGGKGHQRFVPFPPIEIG